MRTLVLHARHASTYSYYDDWVQAFLAPPLRAEALDVVPPGSLEAARRLNEYELIVLLHSTTADDLRWIRPWTGPLQHRRGKLVVFVGNEGNRPRSHCGIAEKIAFMASVRPEVVATGLPLDTGQWLYAGVPGARVVALPHALNPERFQPGLPPAERPKDLGVRTARYSLLEADRDRVEMVEYFQRTQLPFPLVMDLGLGVGSRLGPDAWAGFLASCRGTVTTEAGGAYLDRDDRAVNAVASWLARRHPPLYLFGVEKRLPAGWLRDRGSTLSQLATSQLIRLGLTPGPDAIYQAADPDEVTRRFFTPRPTPWTGKCISSRHFDAMGTKTCQIMFPGRFNDLLEADVHYLALARDFSNVRAVLERFLDPDARGRVVEAALALAMDRHTHRHRVEELLRVL